MNTRLAKNTHLTESGRNYTLLRLSFCLLLIGLCIGLSLLLSRPATALATAVPYTGQILSGTAALNGSYDFQFTLYNAATGGSTVGSTLTKTSVPVANGVFYVELDFGSVYTGTTLYLQTAYRVHPSSGNPDYSLQTARKLFSLSGAADYAALSGSTTSLQGFFVSARTPTTDQVLTWTGTKWQPQTPLAPPTYTAGTGLSLSGTQFSVASGGITNSLIASSAVSNAKIATNAVSNSKLADGSVSGSKLSLPLTASASSDSDLFTITNSGNGRAIVGNSSNSTALKGVGYNGVYGQGTHYGVQASGTQYGVYSVSPAVGVYGGSSGSTGMGVYGINTASDNGAYGLLGGTEPVSGGNYPVGVYGNSSVYGVYGKGDQSGVIGYSRSSLAGGTGVLGQSDSPNGYGVYGYCPSGIGVYGISTSGYGVLASSGSGYAGYFQGNVYVSGTLSKAGGSFKIDDPLDPAHKTLSHSFVESPDMMNIYNGNIALDTGGTATVTMPAYFQALNQDFRYQLTAIGAPGPNLYIAKEVQGNTFQIAGGTPGTKVSWQVTGVRHDAWANAHRIPTEEAKPGDEQGLYLHPKEYGQPEQMGIDFEHTQKSAAPIAPPQQP